MASVQDIKNQVTARLKEISAEIATLEKERTALAKVVDTLDDSSSPARGGRRTGGRSSAARRRAASAGASSARGRRSSTRRRTSSGSGGRAEETVQIIGRRPGITVKEIAAEMGIKPNYLYRVLPALEQQGKVTKQGTGYVPATQ